MCRFNLALALVNLGLLLYILRRMRIQRQRNAVMMSVLKVLDVPDRRE